MENGSTSVIPDGNSADVDINGNDEDEEEDDLITLTGCGQITQWRFPQDILRCPVAKCRHQFGVRSDVIVHYKKKHANQAVLCPICNVPIFAKLTISYKLHFTRVHPDIEFPLEDMDEDEYEAIVEDDDMDLRVKKPTLQKSIRDYMRRDEDDMITLNGGAKWQFPKDMEFCPECGPGGVDLVRSELIAHFKKNHARYTIMCQLCNHTISIQKDPNNFIKHYKEVHPDIEPPTEDNETSQLFSPTRDRHGGDGDDEEIIRLQGCKRTTFWKFPSIRHCPFQGCSIPFNNRSDAIAHYKENHAKHCILCDICKRPYSQGSFFGHFEAQHPDEILPYNLKFNKRQKKDSETDSQNEEDDLIALSGCDQVTNWRFPPDIRHCPHFGCDGVYKNRSKAIIHYKKKHAANMTLCSICKIPVSAKTPKDFLRHHKIKHPTEEIPYNIAVKITPELEVEASPRLNVSIDEPNIDANVSKVKRRTKNDKDLITLSGCRQTTYWRFPPNLTHCPNKRCGAEFEDRSDAIEHYKEMHAVHCILCPKCDRPIAAQNKTNLLVHYASQHPGEMPPYPNVMQSPSNSHTTPKLKKSNEMTTPMVAPIPIKIEISDEDDDDVITLNGCGITTKWKIPLDMERCPVLRCGAVFNVRSDLINHYKFQHANGSILCEICVKPIRAERAIDFTEHFKRRHPSSIIPHNLDGKTPRSKKKCSDNVIILRGFGQTTQWEFPSDLKHCPARRCGHKFVTRAQLIEHYKQMHANNYIMCTICNWPIRALSPEKFIIHFEKMHPNEQLPFNFGTFLPSIPILSSSDRSNDESNDCFDDLIMLTGCNRTTYWKFPQNLTKCPFQEKCEQTFNNRAKLIEHFKNNHSVNCILCTVCDRPICAPSTAKYLKHFEMMHSTVAVPSDFMPTPEVSENNDTNSVASTSEKNGSNIKAVDECSENNLKKIQCPIKDCAYKSRQIEKLQRHWNREHPNFKFPEMKTESLFSWSSPHTSKEHGSSSVSVPFDSKPSTSNSNTTYPSNSIPVSSVASKSSESQSSESDYNPDADYETSNSRSTVNQQNYVTDASLLEPTHDSKETDSPEEGGFLCIKCGSTLRTQIGLQRHTMMKHNIHTPIRKGQKRKLALRERYSKKRKLMTDTSEESEEESIRLSEIIKRRTKKMEKNMKGCSVVLERLPEYGQKSEDQQSESESEVDDDSIKHEIEMENEGEVEIEIEGEKEDQVTEEQATEKQATEKQATEKQAAEEQPMAEKSIDIRLVATSRSHQNNADEPNTDPPTPIMDVQLEDKPVPDSSPGLEQRVGIINQSVLQPPSDTPPTAYMTNKNGYATFNDYNFFGDPFDCMGASDNIVPPHSMEMELPKDCYEPNIQLQTQPVEMNLYQPSNGAESDSSVTLVPNAPAEVITISDSDSSSAATNGTHEISHVKSWHVLMMKNEK